MQGPGIPGLLLSSPLDTVSLPRRGAQGSSPVRDKWDIRFEEMAKLVASWSIDPGTHVGAVAVDAQHVVLATGWNGLPRGMLDLPERLEDRDFKMDHVVHAEMNCLLNASRSGTSLMGSTLYVYGLPICHRCAVSVVQAGIRRVVMCGTMTKKEWEENYLKSCRVFDEVGIEYNRFETVTLF
jgi:dCMP deaminase